eukprot:54704-Rhodomonas_salina.1
MYPGTRVPGIGTRVPGTRVPGYPRTRALVRAVLLQLEHPSPGVLPGYPGITCARGPRAFL